MADGNFGGNPIVAPPPVVDSASEGVDAALKPPLPGTATKNLTLSL